MTNSILLWKAVAALVFGCVLFESFSLWLRPFSEERRLRGSITVGHATPSSADAGGWTYDWTRDRDDYGLTAAQCDAAFPELYYEIDRAAEHWQRRSITAESIELSDENAGGLHLLIHDQRLRVIRSKGAYRCDIGMRIIAVLQQLQRAITSVSSEDFMLPDIEFTIALGDQPNLLDDSHTTWSFTRPLNRPLYDNVWLVPDYHFWAAPLESER